LNDDPAVSNDVVGRLGLCAAQAMDMRLLAALLASYTADGSADMTSEGVNPAISVCAALERPLEQGASARWRRSMTAAF
jgi:hypothetical protein